MEDSIQAKQQQCGSLKHLCSEMQERKALVDNKLMALKYSLSSFSSSAAYFEQRAARSRARVTTSSTYLNQRKEQLVHLECCKREIEDALRKVQRSEAELMNNLALLKSKLEEENKREENKRQENKKSKEEKTKLQTELKLCRERLGLVKREFEDLTKKSWKIDSDLQTVQMEIQKSSRSVEEMELAHQANANALTKKLRSCAISFRFGPDIVGPDIVGHSLVSPSISGRPDVSRRREYYGYYKKDEQVVRYKNGSGYDELGHHGGNHKRPFLLNGHKKRGGARLDDAPCISNGEVSKCDEGVQLPPEKKFKFTPIIWDLEEKEVSISSKSRAVPTSAALSCPKSPGSSVSEVFDAASDGTFAKSPISGNLAKELDFSSDKLLVAGGSAESTISDSRVGMSPSFLEEAQIGTDDLDKIQLAEEEEFVPAKHISTSRWASDSDSPMARSLSDREDTPKREEQASKRSTPESGEIFRESSEDEARLLGSDSEVGVHSSEDEYFGDELEDNDVMAIDKTLDEDTGVDQLEDEEPVVSVQRSMNMLQGCRSVFEFEKLNKISEGTYGIVYRARDKKSGEIVALKKVKMNVGRKEDCLEYGFPISSLREINILLSFDHPSIVNVKEVVMDDHDSVYMVMEYMEHDLKWLMESMKQPFSTSEVKCLMLQLLEGVKYLHDNWVLHRDLKTSNLLLNNQGVLKICDFGMSRQYGSPLKPYTSLVVTLWYRAPELLLGAKKYSTAVDMWSVGCIMAELLAKKPLFSGTTEVDQIDKIFKTLGTPTETIWPGLSELPGAKANFAKQPYNLLRKRFPAASFTGSPVLSESGFDLLNRLLTYDPEKRITVDDALNHYWFHEVPLPKSKDFMPTFPPQHARNK